GPARHARAHGRVEEHRFMAKSRKKSSSRKASTAKDTAEVTSTAKDPVASSAKDAAKDAPKSKNAGKDAAKSKSSAKDAAPRGGEVAEKAKDSTRSTSVKKAAAAESSRTSGRRVAASTQNPEWLAPTAVVLLTLGLAYLVMYYISAGTLPLPIGDWNLAAGFGVLMVGGGMLMFWK